MAVPPERGASEEPLCTLQRTGQRVRPRERALRRGDADAHPAPVLSGIPGRPTARSTPPTRRTPTERTWWRVPPASKSSARRGRR